MLSYVAQIVATTKEEFEAFKAEVEKNAKEQEGSGDEGNEEDEEDEDAVSSSKKANGASKKRAREGEEEEEEDGGEDDEMEGIDEAKFLELLGMADAGGPTQALVECKVADSARVNSLLKAVLSARLALFPSPLDDDDKLLAEGKFRSSHHKMAVFARAQEKKLLNSLISSL